MNMLNTNNTNCKGGLRKSASKNSLKDENGISRQSSKLLKKPKDLKKDISQKKLKAVTIDSNDSTDYTNNTNYNTLKQKMKKGGCNLIN